MYFCQLCDKVLLYIVLKPSVYTHLSLPLVIKQKKISHPFLWRDLNLYIKKKNHVPHFPFSLSKIIVNYSSSTWSTTQMWVPFPLSFSSSYKAHIKCHLPQKWVWIFTHQLVSLINVSGLLIIACRILIGSFQCRLEQGFYFLVLATFYTATIRNSLVTSYC